MKIYKFVIILLAAAFLYSGCDDSGFINTVPQGITSFRWKNLKHVDQNIDGIFELWLRLDSAGNITNYSFGRFNISANGNLVDSSGNPMDILFRGDTNMLKFATVSFITVEPPGDNNSEPSDRVLLSGPVGFTTDSIYADLKLSGSMALGSAGQAILFSTGGGYMINTPTGTEQTCLHGVWLCDSNGMSYFPNGMQLYAPGWVYQAWVKDKSNPNSPIYYSMGRFRDPFGPDFDGAGPCAGPGSFYSKPGEDWIQSGCPAGKPPIQNINSGRYEILVTLEPSDELPGNQAFEVPFMTLYKQGDIVVNCLRRDNVFLQTLPEARIKITYRE